MSRPARRRPPTPTAIIFFSGCSRARIRSSRRCPQGYFAGRRCGRHGKWRRPTARSSSSTVISQVALLGGEDSIKNDFSLAQAANLSGYVYHDTNNNGIRETGENGIGGVTIVVTPVQTLDGSTAPLTTSTTADGSWSVGGLAPGQYNVTETTQPPGLSRRQGDARLARRHCRIHRRRDRQRHAARRPSRASNTISASACPPA